MFLLDAIKPDNFGRTVREQLQTQVRLDGGPSHKSFGK